MEWRGESFIALRRVSPGAALTSGAGRRRCASLARGRVQHKVSLCANIEILSDIDECRRGCAERASGACCVINGVTDLANLKTSNNLCIVTENICLLFNDLLAC